jgi:hypothetical protein
MGKRTKVMRAGALVETRPASCQGSQRAMIREHARHNGALVAAHCYDRSSTGREANVVGVGGRRIDGGMRTMELSLQPDEVTLLTQVLTRALSELREEIAGTDSYDMRQDLKRDEQTLRSLLARLERPAGA